GLQLSVFQAEAGIRYRNVTGVQTCALPISYLLTWDEQEVPKTLGFSNLESIVASPVIKHGEVKGLLYFSSPASKKEYGANELNLIEILSDLFANIVSELVHHPN